jgi:hypothetical protein
MIRLSLIVSLLALNIFFSDQKGWAWYHAHHQLSVQTSYQQVPAHCRALFDYGGLWTGGVESDIIRSDRPLINPSHKNDTWRITASYQAALEVANNPGLSSRRVARSFHYIMDQSEAETNLRKHLQQATGINTRALGYEVLRNIASGTNPYFSQNYARRMKVISSLGMKGVEEEVSDLRNYFNEKVIYATKNLHQPAEAKRFLEETLSYYFTSIIALQNSVMYQFCAEAPRKVQPPPQQATPRPPVGIVSQGEKDALIKEINQVYSTRWYKHWCAKGTSGCAIAPSDQRGALEWWVINSTKRGQLEAVRKRLYCFDPCLMRNLGDIHIGACLENCKKQFPF